MKDTSDQSSKVAISFPQGIERVICFGSGEIFKNIYTFCEANNIEQIIVTSPRQLDTKVDCINLVDWTKRKKLKFHVVEKLTGTWLKKTLKPTRNDLSISKGSPFIFTSEQITILKRQLVNIHGLLPKFRGAASWSWMILADQTKTGSSSIHLVTPRIDDGPIFLSKEYAYTESVRFPRDLMLETQRMEGLLINEFLENIHSLRRTYFGVKQDESRSMYFPRLHTKIHGAIDWQQDSKQIERFILAFSYPYPGAWTLLDGRKIKIMDCNVIRTGPNQSHYFLCGQVFRIYEKKMYVFCRRGALAISFDDVLGGRPKLGDRFYTPSRDLELSYSSRAFYTGTGVLIQREDGDEE